LTTQQLYREIAAMRELMQSQREILEARMDGTDKATALLQAAADRVPTDLEVKVGQLRELVEEKFRGVQTQIAERDRWADDAAITRSKEVQNAFAAAKEAAEKSERYTEKQIDQQQRLLQSETGTLNEKLEGVKDRVNVMESRVTLIDGKTVGQTAQQGSHQTSQSFFLAVVVGGISLVALVFMLIRDIK
jgi:hypothetical protein